MYSFHRLANEDSISFIRDFYVIVQTLPLNLLTEDQLRMGFFSYTLKDRAKAWLISFLLGYLMTWEDVRNKFMEKFDSRQKTSDLRVKIATFSQMEV